MNKKAYKVFNLAFAMRISYSVSFFCAPSFFTTTKDKISQEKSIAYYYFDMNVNKYPEFLGIQQWVKDFQTPLEQENQIISNILF